MGEPNEIYHGLEDGSGDGLAPAGRKQGEAYAAAQSQAVLTAEDAGNLLELLQVIANGGTIPSKAQFVLTGEDEFGNGAPIPIVNGQVKVTQDNPGTEVSIFDEVTLSGLTEENVVQLDVLTKNYRNAQIIPSSSKSTKWIFNFTDDADGTPVITELLTFRTRGDDTRPLFLENFAQDNTGGTGTQRFSVEADQKLGSPATVSCLLSMIESDA